SNAWRRIKPPRDIAELMISRKGFWPYPEVIGIIAAPTIGADGEIINKPGLDVRSKLLLSGTPAIALPEQPTRENALTALEVLEELLLEYQFADEPSRAVACRC